MTTFLTDQLEYESANEELVVQGKISPDIADKMNEEWEKVSFWKSFLYEIILCSRLLLYFLQLLNLKLLFNLH